MKSQTQWWINVSQPHKQSSEYQEMKVCLRKYGLADTIKNLWDSNDLDFISGSCMVCPQNTRWTWEGHVYNDGPVGLYLLWSIRNQIKCYAHFRLCHLSWDAPEKIKCLMNVPYRAVFGTTTNDPIANTIAAEQQSNVLGEAKLLIAISGHQRRSQQFHSCWHVGNELLVWWSLRGSRF